MSLHAYRIRVLAIVSLFLVIALTFTLRMHLTAAVGCVGKAYGTPGCPLRPASSSVSASSSSPSAGYCGNAIVDAGEQCDKGRFNGKTDCSIRCTVLSCGDGVVTKDIGEECDPVREEIYVQDTSGNLTTEIRFADPPACGWYCQPPMCTEEGTCSGGCKQKFFGECSQSSAPTSAVSAASGSTVSIPSSTSASSSALAISSSTSTSSSALSSSVPVEVCGDGIVQTGEQCDTGERNSDTQPNACRTACTAPSCGDGVVDRGEECDTGKKNSDTRPNVCRVSCKQPRCGDNVVDQGEQCDGGKECSKRCKPRPPPAAAVSASSTSKRSRQSRRKAGGAVSSPPADSGPAEPALPVVLGVTGVLVASSALLFRRRIVALFRGKDGAID